MSVNWYYNSTCRPNGYRLLRKQTRQPAAAMRWPRKLYLLGKSTILDLNASVTEKDSASRNFLYALSNYWNLYYMLRSMTLYDFARHSEISVDYKKLEN